MKFKKLSWDQWDSDSSERVRCAVCGQTIDSPPSWGKVYCSDSCRQSVLRPFKVKLCEKCGTEFTPTGPASRFCSIDCREKSVRKECTFCGTVFYVSMLLRNQKTCSNECRYAAIRENRRPTLKGGYLVTSVSKDTPGARSDRRMLEHRYVMMQKIGRPLLPTESVHHIDGDKTNNSPDNLELWHGVGNQPKGVRLSDVPHCSTCSCFNE